MGTPHHNMSCSVFVNIVFLVQHGTFSCALKYRMYFLELGGLSTWQFDPNVCWQLGV